MASGALLKGSGAPLGLLWGATGAPLGCLWGVPGYRLGTSWGLLAPLGLLLGATGAVLAWLAWVAQTAPGHDLALKSSKPNLKCYLRVIFRRPLNLEKSGVWLAVLHNKRMESVIVYLSIH